MGVNTSVVISINSSNPIITIIMSGFLLIDKSPGFTSFDICAKVRRIFNIKKVGHTGTLDPFATGLLVVAVGKATKLIPYLEKAKKTYITKIALGQTSETLDPESSIETVPLPDLQPSQELITKILNKKFSGKISQVPPVYSAIKIKGKKMCDLARAGKKVNIPPRETEVFSLKILSYNFPILEIELQTAAGFYVRSFARDLAEALGTQGICQELRRTKIDDLSVDDAEKIDHVTSLIEPNFIIKNLSQREIPTGRIQDFVAGRAFPFSGVEREKVLVLCGGKVVGVGEVVCGKLQPRVGL